MTPANMRITDLRNAKKIVVSKKSYLGAFSLSNFFELRSHLKEVVVGTVPAIKVSRDEPEDIRAQMCVTDIAESHGDKYWQLPCHWVSKYSNGRHRLKY